jgi:hypothetical protein
MYVQTAAGRHPCQQTTQEMFGMSWVLQATPYTGTMETCHWTGAGKPMCGQFWY